MYKSYSSSTAVTQDSRVVISEFTPASVKLDVQLSGFPTSYSYYVANEEGSGITSKDVAKANATANDWIGEGKATYTITREGIPSTLLKFESFKLTVDGKEFIGNESDKTITYGGDDCNGHTTWGQKDIVATVTYTNLATGAPETASKTITRHITGLPYSANPPKNSGDNPWSGSANKWEGEYVRLHNNTITQTFYAPEDINVEVYHKCRLYSRVKSLTYTFQVGGVTLYTREYSKFGGGSVSDDSTYNNGVLTKNSSEVSCSNNYGTDDFALEYTNAKVYTINLKYR